MDKIEENEFIRTINGLIGIFDRYSSRSERRNNFGRNMERCYRL